MRIPKSFVLSFMVLTGVVTPFTIAQATVSPEASRKLDQLLDGLDRIAMFNGIVIADQGGTTKYQREVGMAQYEQGVPFQPDSLFRIASLSKLYTEAVVASLLEKSLLSLDQTIEPWLVEFPGAGQISIEHLINHRSGIPHTNAQAWGGAGVEVFSLQEIVERLSALPLDYEPGSEQSYSNGGYAVLVFVLEKISGLSWPDLMAREVLNPLGLSNTGVVTDSRAVLAGMVSGYEPGRSYGVRRKSRPYFVEMRPGGGDMYASAADVRKFFSAIWRGNAFGKTGDRLFRSNPEIRVMTGRSPGFYAGVLYEPANDLLVVSLANNYSADFNWAESIASVAMGRDGFIQHLPEIAEKPWTPDSRFVGQWRYEIERFSQQLTIGANSDGSLFVDDEVSASASALLPLKDGGYLETMYYGICKWSEPETDRITCSRWYPEGFVADLVRR